MSSAISRFTSALFAASQENTLALAALNFDFSLYKVEAPTEYQTLGASLSSKRRNIAESGPQHVTARRLGALFRTEIPPAPALSALLQAYGRRVSEIAKQAATDPSDKTTIFAEYTGIDGTSIWAAATSGREALCMQLLACMLARFWSAPEAISIWCELVETRKKSLSSGESHQDFHEITALQANLSRESIAEWDASARSWLRTADAVYAKQHTQLRLIAENIRVDVSTKSKTYESVLDAWISAMTTADKLIQGVAQVTHTGAVLLGLSAWHLYPDMLTYSNEIQEIKQKDPLITPTGLLTVGLEMAPGIEAGVRWSLPLAKLRYYGEPVVVTKQIDPRDDYISYEDLMLVILGSLFTNWAVGEGSQKEACQLMEHLLGSWIQSKLTTAAFLQDLKHACSSYLETVGSKRSRTQRLVALGKRQCGQFMSEVDPLFLYAIMKPEVYIYSIVDPEDRIEYLRGVAASVAKGTGLTNGEDWIIEHEHPEYGHAFATGLVRAGGGGAQRWNHPPLSKSTRTSTSIREPIHALSPWDVEHGRSGTKYYIVFSRHMGMARRHRDSEEQDAFMTYYYPKGRADDTLFRLYFSFYFGLPGVAALYLNEMIFNDGQTEQIHSATHPPLMHEVLENLGKGFISATRTLEATQVVSPKETSPTLARALNGYRCNSLANCRPLHALNLIARIYRNLPGARISTKITRSHITSGRWYRGNDHKLGPENNWSSEPELSKSFRARAFACIALFETGGTDLDPKDLYKLMSLSTGDSIYLAAPLLCDPSETIRPWEVRRVLGSLGRQGLSLLIPPSAPMVRSRHLEAWHLVTHDDYDGKAEDSFANTSLHLSLTDYRIPFANTHEGVRDMETFYQEAVVSVYDGSEWVGDVDILESLEQDTCEIYKLASECPHVPNEWRKLPFAQNSEKSVEYGERHAIVLSTADNWHELLDRPKNAVVARAHNNWLARLAIVALAVHQGCKVYIVPKECCADACFSKPSFIKEWAWSENVVVVY